MEDKILLPGNHNRSISVAARQIEEGIQEIETLFNDSNLKFTLLKIKKNLDIKERLEILNLIKELKIENEKMIKDLDLQPEIFFEDRKVRAIISNIWVILMESTSRSLKGYGQLIPEQAELLDSYIGRLVSIVNKLQSIIK